ncbi:UNKNOWN [Stylonychia lemnae]|uniref:LamG-like jellyroll fold domain-containing protein n=1 Tax=Stylonychia lemnae TaxID=5949 RepID=A0A078AYV1_STYLE|nr:UNKNOWN [Stylonychia lemnae]|eukprot:CDW87620.1 UNKNOWN [Stylonychia lemnae]
MACYSHLLLNKKSYHQKQIQTHLKYCFYEYKPYQTRDQSRYQTQIIFDNFQKYPKDDDEVVGIFNQGEWLELKSQENLELRKFTYIFDLMILNDQQPLMESNDIPSICQVVQKGRDSPANQERTPSIYYNVQSNQIIASVTLKDRNGVLTVDINSISKVKPNLWYTIAVTFDQNLLSLYINGVFDSAKIINDLSISQNMHNLLVGMKDEQSHSDCSFALRNFEIYNFNLDMNQIEARSFRNYQIAIGYQIGGRPADIRFGCTNCTKVQARVHYGQWGLPIIIKSWMDLGSKYLDNKRGYYQL